MKELRDLLLTKILTHFGKGYELAVAFQLDGSDFLLTCDLGRGLTGDTGAFDITEIEPGTFDRPDPKDLN